MLKENGRSYSFNVIAKESPTDKMALSKALEEVREKVMWIYRKGLLACFQVETTANTKAQGEGGLYVLGIERRREGGRERKGRIYTEEMHRSQLYNVMSSEECTHLCNTYNIRITLCIFWWKS